MNRAWLVKEYEGDEWKIVFTPPDRYAYAVKEIVWAEVSEGAPE